MGPCADEQGQQRAKPPHAQGNDRPYAQEHLSQIGQQRTCDDGQQHDGHAAQNRPEQPSQRRPIGSAMPCPTQDGNPQQHRQGPQCPQHLPGAGGQGLAALSPGRLIDVELALHGRRYRAILAHYLCLLRGQVNRRDSSHHRRRVLGPRSPWRVEISRHRSHSEHPRHAVAGAVADVQGKLRRAARLVLCPLRLDRHRERLWRLDDHLAYIAGQRAVRQQHIGIQL